MRLGSVQALLVCDLGMVVVVGIADDGGDIGASAMGTRCLPPIPAAGQDAALLVWLLRLVDLDQTVGIGLLGLAQLCLWAEGA